MWTLDDFHQENPANSVFTEFDRNGSVINHFVKPRCNWSTDESMSKGGQTSFGLTSGQAWAWLPKPQTLILVHEYTGRAKIHQTGLPHVKQGLGVYARQAALLLDGRLLMNVGWQVQRRFHAGWFIWSFRSGWRRINSPTENRYDSLYGVDGTEVIYASSGFPAWPAAFRSKQISSLLESSTGH